MLRHSICCLCIAKTVYNCEQQYISVLTELDMEILKDLYLSVPRYMSEMFRNSWSIATIMVAWGDYNLQSTTNSWQN